MEKILIVDDDAVLCRNLAMALKASGYETLTAYNGEEAVAQCAAADLILLDVMMPGMDGFACCAAIRKITAVPLLFLTSCAEQDEIVRGLDAGADDYIAKPFRLPELLSRVRANLRRCAAAEPPQSTLPELTAAEERLLHLLMQHKGQYLTREQILSALWDSKGDFVSDNTLSVNISRLRDKLRGTAGCGSIRTKRGLGYCWEPEP